MSRAIRKPRVDRRTDALTKERIVDAAIEILDAEGEAALTFRRLTARLATGAGAIYWHVANKDELLAAATTTVITRAMTDGTGGPEPERAIRTIALRVFDTIDAHPWVGAQLSRELGQSAALQIFEGLGEQLLALSVPAPRLFDATSVLFNYILGVAGQNAANARLNASTTDRSALLAGVVASTTQRDPAAFSFVQQVAAQLREHDDREQFLAGIDLILAGIATIQKDDLSRRLRQAEPG